MDDIRHCLTCGEEKITLFLSATFSDGKYTVTNWLMPNQHATKYNNTVEGCDLPILGTAVDDDPTGTERYLGIIRGGGDLKKALAQADYDFLDNVFCGMSDYFCIHLTDDGTSCSVVSGQLVFENVRIAIQSPKCDPEREKELKKYRKDNILTDYKAGYNQQSSRKEYIPCRLMTENKSFRDVV